MHKGIEMINGDWWPKGDKECRPAIMATYRDVDLAIKLCKRKNVVIQAGGNCGIWARYLANHFKAVYTFEPNLTNFLCLNYNATAPNIVRMQAALGMGGSPLSMDLTPKNIGAHSMTPGKLGIIPNISIDSLNLPACDLIQLDLEGYEYYALAGAEVTITEYKPVLMIEDKGHHMKYGLDRSAVVDLAIMMGYEIAKKINRDIILTPVRGSTRASFDAPNAKIS